MTKTTIAWTDHSINPIRAELNGRVGHHCVKVSPGCANCYSSTMQRRFGLPPFEVGKRRGVEPFLDEAKLLEVVRRRKPTRWFWCDMSDLFGEWVPDEWIDRCFAVMGQTPWHTHQVLTKRAGRLAEYSRGLAALSGGERARRMLHAQYRGHPAERVVLSAIEGAKVGEFPWPLSNVWLGVSCENQATADERIPLLLETPAAVRFVSAEPLLGPIDFKPFLAPYERTKSDGGRRGRRWEDPGIDWVIVGGESGPKARPCDVAWIRSIRDECQAAGVPVFVKQLGARVRDEQTGTLGASDTLDVEAHGTYRKLRDRKGEDPSEWPEDLRVREWPR